MFTKYIQAAVWTEHTDAGDVNRDFRALYVFDNGFTNLEEAVKKIELLGHAPQEFVYVIVNDKIIFT